MVAAPYIEELRLTAFKSFRDAVLPMRDLTLLIGRNGSGKSNAIDGLHVLARLAGGEDVREAIDGSRRDGSEVRGGVRGCAPYGDASFKLGCTVVDGADRLCLDLEIQVEPDVQIVYEELHFRPRQGKHRPLSDHRSGPAGPRRHPGSLLQQQARPEPGGGLPLGPAAHRSGADEGACDAEGDP